jgi:sugar (pentulose or hexulose) kinase
MAFIGIDVGTSFIKGAILDTSLLRLRDVCRVPFPPPVSGLPPAFVEIDPFKIRDAVNSLLAQLMQKERSCDGLLLCGQMGGIVLLDETLSPLTNYLSWRDQRCGDLDGLRSKITGQQFAELGNELRPGSGISLLHWLTDQQKIKAGTIPFSLPACVLSHLCGTTASEHPTLALSGLNLTTGNWHVDVMTQLGLGHLNWPKISTRGPVGFFEVNGQEIPCFPAVGDHQCALAGTGLQLDELSLNVSTGSQVSRLSRDWESGDWQARPYFDGHFLNTITHLPAGRSLDALVELFSEIARAQAVAIENPWQYIVQKAQIADDAGLAAQISFFSGSMGETGSLTGLRLENLTVGHIFRAALRNMADNYRQCADRLDARRAWKRIVFSGGLASRLKLLRMFVLEQLPGPYRLCVHEEDTLMGLLVLALFHSGKVSSVEAAARLVRNRYAQSAGHEESSS